MRFFDYNLTLQENLNNAVIALSAMGLIVLFVMLFELFKKKKEDRTVKEKVWLACGFIIAVLALAVSAIASFST